MVLNRGKLLDSLARAVAIAARKEGSDSHNYGYIDRIANANSKDLLIYYLRDAIRVFVTKGEEKELYEKCSKAINKILEIRDIKELREISSYIAAKALLYLEKPLPQTDSDSKEQS